MDEPVQFWYFKDMDDHISSPGPIPSWNLYGEEKAFPDVLHCEKINDRAAGLDWIISPHRHPHLHQFFLIRSGTFEVTADGARLRPAAPCVLTIPRGAVHGFEFSAGTDGYVLTIPLQSLPDIFDPRLPMAAALSVFAVAPADDEMLRLFQRIHAEHESLNPARATMLKAQAAVLAVHVLRRRPGSGRTAGSHDARFQQFAELVQAHFRENWRLNDYARALNLSPRHLGRLCQKGSGQSPTEYLEGFTMREACRLLVYTRDSIAAIGYHLGFDDPSYFSRAFRRHMGLTPRDYRAAFEAE